jgi:adhesin/invasin
MQQASISRPIEKPHRYGVMWSKRSVYTSRLLILLALLAGGCGDDEAPTEPPDTTPAAVSIVAGDDQTATAGTAVAIPPAVIVTNAAGTQLPGVAVSFSVTAGGGSVTGESATTDEQGEAAVGSWTLGTTPGTNELTAVASGLSATFTATGELDTTPAFVNPNAGRNDQFATAGTAVAIPPSVIVTNAAGTRLPGVAVSFLVTRGGGSVTGESATTDDQGEAAVGSWTLGTDPGSNELTAVVAAGLSATFNATGT